MQLLRDDIDLDRFFEHVRAAPERALLLDYDGTLAPFRAARDQAVPYPGIPELLASLLANNTRLVIISGRAVADLQDLLAMEPLPELWGSHGWERRLPDGTYQVGGWDEQQTRTLNQATAWAAANLPAEAVETKPSSVAFHTRALDAAACAALSPRVRAAWEPLAADGGMELHQFDGGLELRVPGRTKGDAVRTILRELDGGAAASFLGDDLTDEDAFEALEGHGLRVLVRAELRPTRADLWLQPPEELVTFLQRWQETQ